MAIERAHDLFYRVAVFVAALVGAVAGIVLVFPLGLAVPEIVVLPLAMAMAGLLAALAAAWVGNLLAPNRTTSRLLPIAALAVAAGVLFAAAIFALTLGLGIDWPFPAFPLLLSALGLAVVASWATWRLRGPERLLGRDALRTAGLLGAALLATVATIFVTCSLVPCIP